MLRLSHYLFPGKDKKKGKVVPCFFIAEHHAMEAYWRAGYGGIAPHILDLGTK